VTVHDLNFKAFGDQMSLSRRMMLGLFVKQSIIRSDKVITVSEFSRNQIIKEYHIPSDKIIVTHEAADLDDFEKSTNGAADEATVISKKNGPYIVAFSSTYANKNIPCLIAAFIKLKKENRLKQKLVLIGHRYSGEIGKPGTDSLEKHEDIIWTGYLSRKLVSEVLKQADFLVFPSFYEGFGLPILEAMAVGVPVVCSKAASLPEVAGDAAVFFDPFSVKDMAEKIALVASNQELRSSLRQRGFQNMERFSWKQTAFETVAVYKDILRQAKQRLWQYTSD